LLLGGPARANSLSLGLDGHSGFTGVVSDLLTGQPIGGAVVTAEPVGAAATTDPSGVYRLDLPPGSYSLTARRGGYVPLGYSERLVAPGLLTAADFDLIGSGLSPEAEEVVCARLGLQVESSAPEPGAASVASASLSALPTTIAVRHTTTTGYTEMLVPLEDYVKGVVPNEVSYTWPAETLKAQAVAARSYGAASQLTRGYVWDDTRSQVYNPANRHPETDAAVDATRNVVVTYAGSVAQAYFFAQCNGSTTRDSERAIDWQHCAVSNWSYIAYCRARSCGGHAAYANGCSGDTYGYRGHGVGMCQYGARARASEGLPYADILQRYYTGVEVLAIGGPPAPSLLVPADGALLLPGPVTLAWSGAGASYNVDLNGQVIAGGLRSTSFPITAAALGTYLWRVRAVAADGTPGDWSAYRPFRVVPQLYRTYFPLTGR
jgi:hypothetical protein